MSTSAPAPEAPSLQQPWHARPTEAVLSALGGSVQGLSAEEAARRLEAHGPNALPAQRRSWLRLLLRQFQDVLVYILFAALALAVATPVLEGHPLTVASFLDAYIIAAILVLNAVLGFVQEYRAEQAIAELAKLTSPRARVRRAGVLQTIPSTELVPGDLVMFEAGDRISADARLLQSSFVSIDESALTGESVPAGKDTAPVAADSPMADQSSMVFSGTLVTRGTGTAVVTATGSQTRTGTIAALVSHTAPPETPLQQRLARLGRGLGLLALAMCAVVLILGALRGLSVLEMLLVAVSLAVSAVPEGLPAVVTVCFALGVRGMARQQVLVRRLDALETLGGVTVIASDKTGTLTQNRMAVTDSWTAPGVEPQALATALATCSHAQLPDQGDPTELALVAHAEAVGAARLTIDDEEVPFTSEGRYMQVRAGAQRFLKGAPERIAELTEGPHDAAPLLAKVDEMAAGGLRVLAAAACDDTGRIRLLGLVGMADPPREGTTQALAQARHAGVRTVMITGDNPVTAAAIAEEIGITSASVLTGAQLDALDRAQIDAALRDGVAIFARVSPHHKLMLLEILQEQGEVVAMTGDGVNDAPALKGAHVGIAMGQRGTEVAREAASIVLADDRYATIVSAIREGRRIHDNIRKFVLFLLRANFDELLLVLVSVMVQLPLPFLPLHILWINLLTDGLPALALASEPAEPDIMQRPPRPRGHGLLHGEISRLVLVSLLTFSVTFAWYVYALRGGQPIETVRATTLTLAIVLELLLAISSRSRHPLWRVPLGGNPAMLGAVAVVLAAHLALLYPPLAGAFHVTAISASDWLTIAGVGAATLAVVEVGKALRPWLPELP